MQNPFFQDYLRPSYVEFLSVSSPFYDAAECDDTLVSFPHSPLIEKLKTRPSRNQFSGLKETRWVGLIPSISKPVNWVGAISIEA